MLGSLHVHSQKVNRNSLEGGAWSILSRAHDVGVDVLASKGRWFYFF